MDTTILSIMPDIARVHQPELPRWQRPEKTSHSLPWADIRVLDLAKFDDENGGRESLVEELRGAVSVDPGSRQSLVLALAPDEVEHRFSRQDSSA